MASSERTAVADRESPEPGGMTLNELVRADSVLCNVEARSKKHALEILSELLSHGAEELRQQDIFSALAERERLGCTALGQAVAAPHARIADTPYPVAALLKLSSPIDFDTADGGPVDLIFGLIVPEEIGDDEIDAFSGLTDLLSRPETQEALRGARSSRELYEALMRQEPPPAPADGDDGNEKDAHGA